MRNYIDIVTGAITESVHFSDVDHNLVSKVRDILNHMLNQNEACDVDDVYRIAEMVVEQYLVSADVGQQLTPNLLMYQLYDLHPMDNSNIDTALLTKAAVSLVQYFANLQKSA